MSTNPAIRSASFSCSAGIARERVFGAEWMCACVAKTAAGRRFLTERLTGLGFRVVPSHANFVLVDVREDAQDLWARLLRRGVIVRPAGGWGLTTFMRVTVGTQEQNERFLEALRTESRALAARG